MNVALVHDWGNQIGGAENVLAELKALFPQAPVYMSMYAPAAMPTFWREWDIRTSFMDHLPLVKRYHQLFLPLYPLAFEGFDLSSYDLVLSNKSGFCHGVITPPETLHICYCLTPTRYVWRYHEYARREGLGRLADALLRPLLNYLRLWDRLAAERVDYFIAISQEVRRRIAKYYRRDSVVIYPPVDTRRYTPNGPPGDYYLVVSRLIPYKRIDLAVRACTALGRPLKIVGEGRDQEALQEMAGPNVEFLGRVSDDELLDLLRRCRAFIFPGLEDFGIAPVEAMACGRPVIAYAGGGALETVVEGRTGLFFREQTSEALAAAIERFETLDFDPAVIRRHAEQFDTTVFRKQLVEFIDEKYSSYKHSLHSLPSGHHPAEGDLSHLSAYSPVIAPAMA